MKTLVFASNNVHKLEEIRSILGGVYEIKSLKDIGCDVDIPETGVTFEANALQKAMYVKEHYGLDCFADDSGLQVEALGGEPGVYSARYASLHGVDDSVNKDSANIDVLLDCLSMKEPDVIAEGPRAGEKAWKACFSTCVALVLGGQQHFFHGKVDGCIISERRGDGGFGYDPVFVPEGYDKTFAELGNEVKNGMSHRAKAVEQLVQFLNH